MKIQSDKLAEVKIERFFAMTELGIEQPPKIQLEPFWLILSQNYSFSEVRLNSKFAIFSSWQKNGKAQPKIIHFLKSE